LAEPFPTIRQSINVFEIEETTIANSTVDKIFKPYEAISEGETFSGDDAHMSVLLDFDFIYDGFVYDKVQMSTNGWLEFGTGTDGSERGLSTSEQLGGYSAFENEKLAGSGRPTKALGVWWDDLSADAGGKVSYQTLGNEPNRVFVCQWENIRGFWNQETTTAKLNFQVRLYEGSNKIEYCYGELIPGSIGGQDFGASIGFKDHVGGDFRFFDIAANGSGTVTQLILDLNPMSDWPGKDSAFVIQTITTDVKDDSPTLPRKIVLYQNYPNPFNPTTTIKYSIPSVGRMASFANDDNNGIRQSGDWRYNVTLKVYDILGKEVATLVNEHQRPGNHAVSFDASLLSSGVYIYKLSAGHFTETRKMILLR